MKMISRVMGNMFNQEPGDPASEVSAAASALEVIAAQLQLNAQGQLKASPTGKTAKVVANLDPAAIAKKIIIARTKASEILAEESLSSGPALDILFDLFVNENIGRKVSVTDAVYAARCPMTTALRWLALLEDSDLITKVHDPRDGRRTFVLLTEQGLEVTHACIKVYAQV